MTRYRLLARIMFLAFLLGGCALPAMPWARSKPAEPAPTPPAPALPSVRAETLFPGADAHATYGMADQGKPEVKVEEDWIRDGGRLVFTQNGNPYATWDIRDDGVWRLDPKGGGALLRYFPPLLENGAVWKQQSGGQDVWFALAEDSTACESWKSALGVDQCWQLRVLNRGELTTFLFGAGAGPLKADAVNYLRPADSFAKALKAEKPGSPLLPAERKAVLDKAGTVRGQAAAVTQVGLSDFDAAVKQAGG